MYAASEKTPPPISTVTVAYMIQLFDGMYSAPTPLIHPMFDIDQLSTTLFAMGFDQNFLSACRYRYYWNFKSLLPSLYDGTFYDGSVGARSRGQGDLRGFATFLCGAFLQHSGLRTRLNVRFEDSLLHDGYRFEGRTLVEKGLETSGVSEVSELPNRESLESELLALLTQGTSAAVVFIDLDHFKQVNDQLSHTQGDECLVAVVRTISSVLQHRGKLYRVGGDEFCALLPNFGFDEAMATAERVRKCVDVMPPVGGRVKVTASLGVASSDQKELSSADALIRAADEAMYVSKFTTRNRVCGWPPKQQEVAQASANRKRAVTTATGR